MFCHHILLCLTLILRSRSKVKVNSQGQGHYVHAAERSIYGLVLPSPKENYHDTWNAVQDLCVFVNNQGTFAIESCVQRSRAFNLHYKCNHDIFHFSEVVMCQVLGALHLCESHILKMLTVTATCSGVGVEKTTTLSYGK